MKIKFKLLALLIILYSAKLNSVSLVYNLRITEATKLHLKGADKNHPSVVGVSFIDQIRKRYDGTNQNILGGLGTAIYAPDEHYYFKTDFAIANVAEKLGTYHFSRTQSDDVVFTAGYSQQFNKRFGITVSGLLGVPMHHDLFLEGHIQLGTGHVGLGGQVDGSFAYSTHRKHLILMAARLIHFFPRYLTVEVNNRFPVFKLSPGNLFDILIAHRGSFGKHHKLEIGYDFTLAFGSALRPQVPAIGSANFMLSSFYASYMYGFLISKLKSAVISGMAFGFANNSFQPITTKRVLTFWLTWGINF